MSMGTNERIPPILFDQVAPDFQRGFALAAHRVGQDARCYHEAAFARHAPEVRMSSWRSFNGLVQHEFRPIAKTANKLLG
jgi:hypothetical protein